MRRFVRLLTVAALLAAGGLLAACDAGSDSASACRAAPTQPPPTETLPRPGRYSQDQLEALTLRIAAEGDALATAGIQMSFWGPDLDADRVVVTIKTPDACGNADIVIPDVVRLKDQSIFNARYGKGRVLVSSFTQPDGQAL